ncbi:MAG: hypothetical protein KY454_10150 [Actinobacteria bacterium]|nr:hypothetical protein [Actinomycetota bacterium]
MFTTPLQTGAPDGRRAGATWVAATGAFLLLAAAAVFVAVRWDQLPEAAKLALVGALTGGFLVGGRALRRTLPATGDVLFHLGALLLPVDVAGLNLRLGLGWRALLLAEGVVGVAAFGTLAASSVVLAWAAASAVVVLAGGVAAVSAVPAPLALAGAAAGAHLLRRHRVAVAWAAVAGLAPVAGAVAAAVIQSAGTGVGHGVLVELGLAGPSAALLAVVSGGLAALVLAREASRQRDLALVALAAMCLVSGAATTWANAAPTFDANVLAATAGFLIVQTVAMLCQRDPFWRRPARAVAVAGEVVAGLVAMPLAALILLMAPLVEEGLDLFADSPGWQPEPVAGVSWGLLACGWMMAAWRRQPPQPSPAAALRAALADDRTVAFFAAAAGAGLVVGTASAVAVAAGLVALGAVLVACGGILATIVAAAAVVWAPVVVVNSDPLVALPVGLAGAAVLALAALRWRHTPRRVPTVGLSLAASLLAFGSCLVAQEETGRLAAMLAAVFAAWGVALAVERASTLAGHLVRATMLLGVAGTIGASAGDVLAVALCATLLFALDAARHDEPAIGTGAAVTLQVVLGALAAQRGLDEASAGLLLCVGAVVAAGLAAVTPQRWRLPLVAAAAAGLTVGLPLAAADTARFAEAMLLSGGMAIGAGLVLRNGLVGHAGGAVATAGLALHLVVDGVTASEAFVAPVALQLVVAGWQLRRRSGVAAGRPSSWVAYGPAIALMGGAAVAERLGGGEAWHGLLAGAVGVVAVGAGGWHRLAGPLFLGTGLVVAVTVIESLNTLAGVPTWGWLAVGGVTLLGAGVALERSDTSPGEAGRRLVDVLGERFD